MSRTLTVLSPSPAQISLWSTVSTPSGPEVLLFPVNPIKPGLNWPTIASVVVSTTIIALLVRLAKKYRFMAASTKLMSKDVILSPFNGVMAAAATYGGSAAATVGAVIDAAINVAAKSSFPFETAAAA